MELQDLLRSNKTSHIHFVGIKGVAMTALALFMRQRGFTVSGSDVEETFPTDELLRNTSITLYKGFDSRHVRHANIVIYTGAHNGRENIEVSFALSKNIPVYPHGKALGICMQKHKQISVAGCHGKTTTTAMTASILSFAGRNPSYAVGCGKIFGLGNPGEYGNGEWFVAEADEYVTDPGHDDTPRFYWQNPNIFVITNIDFDHPDVYKDISHVKQVFATFISRLSKNSHIILNADDKNSNFLYTIAKNYSTVGTGKDAMFRIHNARFFRGKTQFELMYKKNNVSFTVKIPGEYNIINAAMAIAAAHSSGIELTDISKMISKFQGTKRRFEKIGEKNGSQVYDDYAHHPAEIQATLHGIRLWYPNRRIVAVFQPHTFTRTQRFLKDFARSFHDADIVCIADIYGSAREKGHRDIHSKKLVSDMKHIHEHAVYTKNYEKTASYLSAVTGKKDIIVFMGAGDIYLWSKQYLKMSVTYE